MSQAAEHFQPAPEDPVHMRLAVVFSHCSSYQAKGMLQFCQAAQLTANAAFPNTSHADAKHFPHAILNHLIYNTP